MSFELAPSPTLTYPPAEMSAWQWTRTGRPLERRVVPVPEPAPGDVLLRVRAAGLCHTDVGVLDQEFWAERIRFSPITIGHEVAGEVVAVGAGVTAYAPGDRVGVCPTGPSVPGFSRDGGYAEYSLAPVESLVRMPDGLSYGLAAMATDAGMTSHRAVVRVAEVGPGDRVGIIGLGGLGQVGARLAVLRGAEVHAADIRPEAAALAADLEVAAVHASADALVGLDLDVVVDFAGFGTTTQAALGAIRREGTVVMVGMAATDTTLRTADIINNRARILGTSGGDVDDIAAVFAHLASGELRPVVEEIGFDEISAGLDRLRRHAVTGRLVATRP